jgi:HlyD family secretion protein
VTVDIATVSRAPLTVEVDEDGMTRVRDRFIVAAPIGGNLARIELEAGDAVTRDQVIGHVLPPNPALLDPRSRDEATARLAASQAHQREADTAIARATAARDAAIREAERGRKLVASGAITASERERLELAEQLAVADREAAELGQRAATAEVAAARAVLGDGPRRLEALGGRRGAGSTAFPITAPIGGRVLRVVRDSAGPVVAGAALLELADPKALEVTVDVLSSDAARTAPGMLVELEGWGGERMLPGRVRLVEPSGFTRISALGVDEQRVKIVVVLDDVPPSLGDGFRVEARIVIWRGDTLIVPASAVFRDRERWAVYAVEGDHARLVPVELGRRGRLDVEIAHGLAVGATVVVHPSDLVRDGVAVVPR